MNWLAGRVGLVGLVGLARLRAAGTVARYGAVSPKLARTASERRRMGLVALLLALLGASPLAQTPATPEPEPIRCWWRTSSGAIAVGESFSLVLTCATLDTDTVQAVVDESRLGAGAVQLAPFEIVGSNHPSDLHSPGRRFVQYTYTLRLIDADAIGRDVKIPDLQIRYRLQSRDRVDPAAEGRERIYVLPGIALRILSLVPTDATDIRDGAEAGFEGVEGLRFRARLFEVAAIAFGVLAIVVAFPLLGRLWGRTAPAASSLQPRVSERAALRHVADVLDEVRRASRGGWTEALLSRALAALRIAAAGALNQPVRQRWIGDGDAHPDGSILIPGTWRDRRRIVMTSPLTTTEIAGAIEALPAKLADRREALQDLHASVAAFTGALYQRGEPGESMPLDEALDAAERAVDKLRRAVRWRLPIRLAEQPRPRLESSR
jgi:hypothetical protein